MRKRAARSKRSARRSAPNGGKWRLKCKAVADSLEEPLRSLAEIDAGLKLGKDRIKAMIEGLAA